MIKQNKSTWYVYIAQCADDTLYTGIALNLKRRIQEHNSKKGSKSVRGKIPLQIVYQETRKTRSLALKREAVIKKLTRPQKLAMITTER